MIQSGNVNNILSMIPLSSGTYGSLINFELQNSIAKSESFSLNISNIGFSLYDDLFNPFELCQNSLVVMEINLQYGGKNVFEARLR